MLGFAFYHGHLRKLISVFGSLFDNIKVATVDGGGVIRNVQTVPLRYAGAEPTLVNPSPDDKPYNETFPRMSFELIGIAPDKDRSVNPNNQIGGVRAPSNYVVDFGLYILARNLSDSFQIMEQILPFFNPTFTVEMMSPLGTPIDIPITITAVSIDDSYEGDEDKERRVEININFSAYLDFYGPTGTAYEWALVDFINKTRDPDDPTPCSPPRGGIPGPGKRNRIEKIYVDFWTNKNSFCSQFDLDPTNFGQPDTTVSVEATPQEIYEYDNPPTQ